MRAYLFRRPSERPLGTRAVPTARCLTMLILLLVLAAVVGAALCLRMRPVLAEPYLEQTGLHKKKALAGVRPGWVRAR